MENIKQPKILKWALILSIIIILNLFYNVSLDLILDRPQFDEFCPTEQVQKSIGDKTSCIESGGAWTQFDERVPVTAEMAPKGEGYCDQQYTCRQEYDAARENYEKKVFISLISLGVLTFAVSLFVKSNPVISNALALAAVLDFVIASMRYWQSAEELLKVVILGIALAILFYLAYKKFKE